MKNKSKSISNYYERIVLEAVNIFKTQKQDQIKTEVMWSLGKSTSQVVSWWKNNWLWVVKAESGLYMYSAIQMQELLKFGVLLFHIRSDHNELPTFLWFYSWVKYIKSIPVIKKSIFITPFSKVTILSHHWLYYYNSPLHLSWN